MYKIVRDNQADVLRKVFPMTHHWRMKQIEKANVAILEAMIATMMFPISMMVRKGDGL